MEKNPFVQAGALSPDLGDLGEIPHASPFPTPFDQAGAIDGGVDQLKDSGPFIPLCHILEATNNFDDALVIGVGGFGKVYEANIDDGATTTVVAIKPLNAESRQGAQEFWTEVKLLSKFRHTNLVALIGYCNENREKILVYEYMAQGSLANHLYETSTREESGGSRSHLTWEQRLNICLDAACGLDHLHNGIVPGIIHRDVKGKIRDLHTMPTIPRMMPLLTERQDTRSVKLKATYGDTTIKFNLPLTSGISELNKEVLKRLEFELGRFKVEYEDEDGVLILIACDEDVRDYLQFLTSPGNQVIKPLVLKTVPNATNVCKNH